MSEQKSEYNNFTKLWDTSVIIICGLIFLNIINHMTEFIIHDDPRLLLKLIAYALSSILAFIIVCVIFGILLSENSIKIIDTCAYNITVVIAFPFFICMLATVIIFLLFFL